MVAFKWLGKILNGPAHSANKSLKLHGYKLPPSTFSFCFVYNIHNYVGHYAIIACMFLANPSIIIVMCVAMKTTLDSVCNPLKR